MEQRVRCLPLVSLCCPLSDSKSDLFSRGITPTVPITYTPYFRGFKVTRENFYEIRWRVGEDVPVLVYLHAAFYEVVTTSRRGSITNRPITDRCLTLCWCWASASATGGRQALPAGGQEQIRMQLCSLRRPGEIKERQVFVHGELAANYCIPVGPLNIG